MSALAAAEPAPRPRHLLVVANETVAAPLLEETVRFRAAVSDVRVLVVCPAANSLLRHWTSDVNAAVAAAQERLAVTLARFADAGVAARGAVGDPDPLQAMEDALRFFPADEILVSTHPRGRSRWFERDVAARACERFGLPVLQLVGAA